MGVCESDPCWVPAIGRYDKEVRHAETAVIAGIDHASPIWGPAGICVIEASDAELPLVATIGGHGIQVPVVATGCAPLEEDAVAFG